MLPWSITDRSWLSTSSNNCLINFVKSFLLASAGCYSGASLIEVGCPPALTIVFLSYFRVLTSGSLPRWVTVGVIISWLTLLSSLSVESVDSNLFRWYSLYLSKTLCLGDGLCQAETPGRVSLEQLSRTWLNWILPQFSRTWCWLIETRICKHLCLAPINRDCHIPAHCTLPDQGLTWLVWEPDHHWHIGSASAQQPQWQLTQSAGLGHSQHVAIMERLRDKEGRKRDGENLPQRKGKSPKWQQKHLGTHE